jgi:hypothetical protein
MALRQSQTLPLPTHCTTWQLQILHSNPHRSPSHRQLPRPPHSLSHSHSLNLSPNPDPRPRLRPRNLSLNRSRNRSFHNLSNPHAQLQHPLLLLHPRPGAQRRRSRPRSRQRGGRRPLAMGHWALQRQVRHLCILHRNLRPSTCAKIDLYHARRPNHLIRLLRPSMAWVHLLVLCPRRLCTQWQLAIPRQAVPRAHPRSLFSSLRKGSLSLSFKTRFNNHVKAHNI